MNIAVDSWRRKCRDFSSHGFDLIIPKYCLLHQSHMNHFINNLKTRNAQNSYFVHYFQWLNLIEGCSVLRDSECIEQSIVYPHKSEDIPHMIASMLYHQAHVLKIHPHP